MRITRTELEGVLIIEPKVHEDARGFFVESFRANRYADAGIEGTFVQDNHSRSSRGVLRGLHFQLEHPQGKLVSVISGAIFDVAVDIRRGSPTFGQWTGTRLDDQRHGQLYVPPGFAHGYCVLSDTADFVYKCTDYYHGEDDRGIAWNDPDLGIDWPIDDPVLSERDQQHRRLCDMKPEELPRYEAI